MGSCICVGVVSVGAPSVGAGPAPQVSPSPGELVWSGLFTCTSACCRCPPRSVCPRSHSTRNGPSSWVSLLMKTYSAACRLMGTWDWGRMYFELAVGVMALALSRSQDTLMRYQPRSHCVEDGISQDKQRLFVDQFSRWGLKVICAVHRPNITHRSLSTFMEWQNRSHSP